MPVKCKRNKKTWIICTHWPHRSDCARFNSSSVSVSCLLRCRNSFIVVLCLFVQLWPLSLSLSLILYAPCSLHSWTGRVLPRFSAQLISTLRYRKCFFGFLLPKRHVPSLSALLIEQRETPFRMFCCLRHWAHSLVQDYTTNEIRCQ